MQEGMYIDREKHSSTPWISTFNSAKTYQHKGLLTSDTAACSMNELILLGGLTPETVWHPNSSNQ